VDYREEVHSELRSHLPLEEPAVESDGAEVVAEGI